MANQMPEAEAIEDKYNGFFFEKDNINDLAYRIEEWFRNNIEPEKINEQCYEVIDEYYNPDYQLSVFNRAIKDLKPRV
jgi:glycosyltransferase involved in cell wall biosynthesis